MKNNSYDTGVPERKALQPYRCLVMGYTWDECGIDEAFAFGASDDKALFATESTY